MTNRYPQMPPYSGYAQASEHGRIRIYQWDCMELLKQTPDNYYDLCICDPPYGINWLANVESENKGKNWRKYEQKGWDAAIPNANYFTELFRVSRAQIIWGGNYMVEHLRSSSCWVIWDKMQEFDGAMFEMAWTSFNTPAKAFRMSRVEAYTRQVKIHPTQKPVALYRWLLKNYAKPGQRILDTHLGSGSIAIACDIEGFDLVATEIDADYIAGARKRLSDHQAQPRLFAPEPTQHGEQLTAL